MIDYKKFKIAFVAIVFGIGMFSQAAFSQEGKNGFLEKPKFYLGGGGGLSTLDTGVSSLTGTAKLDEDDIGYKGLIGVQFHKYFAAEGFYADFGKAELTGNNGDTFAFRGTTYQFTANNVTISLAGKSFGFAGVGILPVHEMVAPFVKVGVHFWDAEGSVASSAGNASLTDDGTDIYFGGGVQFNIHENVAFRAEYERFKFDDEDVDYISGSLIFKF